MTGILIALVSLFAIDVVLFASIKWLEKRLDEIPDRIAKNPSENPDYNVSDYRE